AIEIRIDHRAVVVRLEHLERALWDVCTGGIDEHFHAAELAEHLQPHRFHRARIADIAGHHERAEHVGRDLDERLETASDEGDTPALFCKSAGDGGTHAAAGSGDDGGFFHMDLVRKASRKGRHNRKEETPVHAATLTG